MTIRGRFVSRLLAVLLAVVGSVAVGAPPASAGDSHTLQYVALGDSYAAGRGGGEYLDEVCKQTAAAYPEVLDSRKHVHLQANLGCSGATTLTVINTQVPAIEDGTTLVTLTVGANDLGVADIEAKCTADPAGTACQLAIANALSLLPQLAGGLVNIYTAVATTAPRAEILVTGYPHLFDDAPAGSPAAAINAATDALNQTIATTVANMPDRVNISYVDVVRAFLGHGVDSLDPFINVTGDDIYHPNKVGYEAYARAISAALP
jgi:lysophospholipase L1-like esterase